MLGKEGSIGGQFFADFWVDGGDGDGPQSMSVTIQPS